MLFYPIKKFLLPLLSIAFIWAAPSYASNVLSIGDGDTITITNGAQKTRVRLACIDAPETSQASYGMESRQSLQRLLPIGTEVTVRSKATDRYGRTVGEVLRGSTNINQQQVASAIPSSIGSTSRGVTVRPTPTWRTMLA